MAMRAILFIALAVSLVVIGSVAWIRLAGTGEETAGPAELVTETVVEAPVEAEPAPDPETAPVPPSFDIVRVEPDGRTVAAGRAVPGAQVGLRSGDNVIGEAAADDRGEWVILPDAPLAPGQHRLTVAAEAGQGTLMSEQVVIVDVPPRPDRKPLVVLTDPQAPSRVLQAPGEGIADDRLVFEAVDYGEDGAIRFSGFAPAGAQVLAYVDNEPAGGATADGDGRWTLTPDVTILPGTHELRIDQVAEDGTVVARVAVPFERASPEDLRLTEAGQVVVQPGNNLWLIAHRLYGEGPRYVRIYEANQDQIRDPDLIYPGQIFEVPQEE